MRDVPASITAAWREGLFVGDRKPVARVTVQHPTMFLRKYSLMSTFSYRRQGDIKAVDATMVIDPSKGHKVNQIYADFLFTKLNTPKELPNVKAVSWTRSIDTDVADCTIECMNTAAVPTGGAPRSDQLDQPGFYTYSRGGTAFSKRWGHERNSWFGMLVPDNIIRTFEGYGCNPDVPPERDEHLVQTGMWIIDSVTMDTQGSLTIKCRDIGRILMDQMYYKPVVPEDFYNEDWSNWSGEYPGETVTKRTKLKVKAADSSNTPWIGNSLTNAVHGHKLQHAFDGDPGTYWLSIGNDRPSRRFAYEWVQCSVPKQTVSGVRVRTKKKGYTCYVSVKVDGVWQGTGKINYHEDGIGKNGSDIHYVKSERITTEGYVDIDLPKNYAKAEAVRVTLGNLQNFHMSPFSYRGGIRDVEVYGLSKSTKKRKLKVGPIGSNPNKYYDYTHIVKLLCAWGGFFWPDGARQRLSDGTFATVQPGKFDSAVLGKGVRGRVWGDFMESGTSGPAALNHSNFDKKSLMDGIAYVRDILGFLFFIDETGGVQWRLPNIYNYGCLRSTMSAKPGYIKYAHPIDEKTVLTALNCVIDSKNVREAFFVGDINGKIGAFAPGFNPNPTGLRRIAGWTDQNFEKTAECELMADMMSLRQLFTYRTDRVTIPANPAIQIDDQVRIFERVTSEGYLHYVKGISSSLDMESGQWTYDLDTHWLGFDRPGSIWLFNPKQFRATTQKTIRDQLKSALDSQNVSRKQVNSVVDDEDDA
jgi:hypothetical protein